MYTELVMEAAGKKVTVKHIDGPLGVRGRNSDTSLLKKNLTGRRRNRLRMGLQKRMHGLMNR